MLKCPNLTSRGFTIVELVISIFVIAILATIVGVTYSNSQEKVKIARSRSHLESLAEAASNFRTMNPAKEYPVSDADFAKVVKDAGIYEVTRPGKEESYAICSTTDGFVFVAWAPIMTSGKKVEGMYTYAHDNGQFIESLGAGAVDASSQLSQICNAVYPGKYSGQNPGYMRWTYDLP